MFGPTVSLLPVSGAVLAAGVGVAFSSRGLPPVSDEPDDMDDVPVPGALPSAECRNWFGLTGKAASRLPKNGVAM
jgi:hypothetical protein